MNTPPTEAAILRLPPPQRYTWTRLCQWWAKARPKQRRAIETDTQWSELLLRSGRGWGKTEAAIGYIANLLAFPPPNEPNFRIGLIVKRGADVKIITERANGLLSYFRPQDHRWNKTSGTLTILYNNSVLQCFSAEAPQSIRGDEVNRMVMEEPSSYRHPEILDLADFMTRRGHAAKLYSTTLKRNETTRKMMERIDPRWQIQGGTAENTALPAHVVKQLYEKWDGTAIGRQELHGEWVADVPGALFQSANIEANRLSPEQTDHILTQHTHTFAIGVDPQGAHRPAPKDIDETSILAEDSGTTGIVIASLASNGHFYIWADTSLTGTPEEWGAEVANTAALYGGGQHATAIIPEINFGGDMVTSVIQRACPGYAIQPVRATESKTARAEPISILYTRNRVHHVGIFPELEDEMTGFVPQTRESPNRLDALVWALTALDRAPPIIY